MRIALAFKEFVIHEDIQSFLCVLNKHPRSGDNALDKNTLSDIFQFISMENGWEGYDKRRTAVFLDGTEYDGKRVI